jgi:hypothetical protein
LGEVEQGIDKWLGEFDKLKVQGNKVFESESQSELDELDDELDELGNDIQINDKELDFDDNDNDDYGLSNISSFEEFEYEDKVFSKLDDAIRKNEERINYLNSNSIFATPEEIAELAARNEFKILYSKLNEVREKYLNVQESIDQLNMPGKDLNSYENVDVRLQLMEGELSLLKCQEQLEDCFKAMFSEVNNVMNLKYGESDLDETEINAQLNSSLSELDNQLQKADEIYKIATELSEKMDEVLNKEPGENEYDRKNEQFGENMSSDNTNLQSSYRLQSDPKNVPMFGTSSYQQNSGYSSPNIYDSGSNNNTNASKIDTSGGILNPSTQSSNKTSPLYSSIQQEKPKKTVSFSSTTELGNSTQLSGQKSNSTNRSAPREEIILEESHTQPNALNPLVVLQKDIQSLNVEIAVLDKKAAMATEMQSAIKSKREELNTTLGNLELEEGFVGLSKDRLKDKEEVIEQFHQLNTASEKLETFIAQQVPVFLKNKDALLKKRISVEQELYKLSQSQAKNSQSISNQGAVQQSSQAEESKEQREKLDEQNQKEDLLKDRLLKAEYEMATMLLPSILFQRNKENKLFTPDNKLKGEKEEEELVKETEGKKESDEGKEGQQ